MKTSIWPPSATPTCSAPDTNGTNQLFDTSLTCFDKCICFTGLFHLCNTYMKYMEFPQCDHVSPPVICVTVRLTWTVGLPLQGKWQYSNSCVLLRLYRSSSCGVVWVHSHSGCSCWAGTGWRAGQFAARWQTSAVPTCRPYERLASSCGGHHRTLSHCRGLLGGGHGRREELDVSRGERSCLGMNFNCY